MALVLYWYSYICIAFVVASYVFSSWIIWNKDIANLPDLVYDDTYEGLLVSNLLPNNHVGSSQLWISCWKGVHPGWLLATRILSLLILAGIITWDVVLWGGEIFVYYTQWTHALVMIYFLIGSVVSAYGCWLTSKNIECEDLPYLEDQEVGNSHIGRLNLVNDRINDECQYNLRFSHERAGFWGYLMQCVYQTCAGAVMVTDIVFWCLLVPFASNAELSLDVLVGCMHTLNLAFLLVETGLNSLPFPWFRIAYFMQLTCIYVIFQWVIHACGFPWWPYPFLELDTPWAPLWYIGFGLFHVPCFGLYMLAVKAKNSYFPRWFPHSFVGFK